MNANGPALLKTAAALVVVADQRDLAHRYRGTFAVILLGDPPLLIDVCSGEAYAENLAARTAARRRGEVVVAERRGPESDVFEVRSTVSPGGAR